ncbi:ParM/StbA family protein [Deferribacter autotrophicus]|uniref:ParM/StbA family protein n=1 Tax=Deferribacter autotrophicus TaxID=500465 RepID=A0A5A8F4V6_9BACT|nr:ParM/StbA family protein [Deferribacter autotrophicus]KAA0259086.1 ParM/StbA family protein [Deferribacter autotrophicus]
MKKVVSIDVGFGDVKVVYERAGNLVFKKFPTAIKEVLPTRIDFSTSSSEKEYYYNSRYYVIGENAKNNSLNQSTVNSLVEFTPLLIYKAIIDYQLETENTIFALGLPLYEYTQKNKQRLKAKLADFEVDYKKQGYFVHIYPQGVGCYFAYTLYHKQEIQNALILDIGFNTVEIILLRNGRIVKTESTMLAKNGIMQIAGLLKRLLLERKKINLSYQEAIDILINKSITIYGKKFDLSDIVTEVKRMYSDQLLKEIYAMYDDNLRSADRLLLCGGGAYHIGDHLPEEYNGLAEILPDAEFANALGYYFALKYQLEKK